MMIVNIHIDDWKAKAEGYRKALEQIRDGENRMFFSADWCRSIAREALSDAATAQPKSLYAIPPGCICMGDGLMGMECQAKEHAKLKQQPVPEAGEPKIVTRLLGQLNEAQETIRQRDERIKSLRAALKPFHEAYVLYENALTLPRAEEHLQSVSSIHFALASDIYESTAPICTLSLGHKGDHEPCPTCKGRKSIYIESAGETVPCPTCTEPK